MAQWEHYVQVIDSGPEGVMEVLNNLGSDGWELVAVTPGIEGRFLTTYLKRPKKQDPTAVLKAMT